MVFPVCHPPLSVWKKTDFLFKQFVTKFPSKSFRKNAIAKMHIITKICTDNELHRMWNSASATTCVCIFLLRMIKSAHVCNLLWEWQLLCKRNFPRSIVQMGSMVRESICNDNGYGNGNCVTAIATAPTTAIITNLIKLHLNFKLLWSVYCDVRHFAHCYLSLGSIRVQIRILLRFFFLLVLVFFWLLFCSFCLFFVSRSLDFSLRYSGASFFFPSFSFSLF